MKPVFITLLLLVTQLYANNIQANSERSLNQYFGDEAIIEFSYFEIPAAEKGEIEQASHQHFFRDKIHYWSISKNDSLVGIAALDNVMGKAMPITFLVIFDMSGVILKSDIIRYRESIGGEVSNPRWLKQFTGLDQQDIIDPKIRIDGISGATISVKSISKGIKKLSLLFPSLKAHISNQ